MNERPIWKAEQSPTGGHLCKHNHHSRRAAERCLPRLPRRRPGSLTRYFSLAQVIAVNDAAARRDRLDRTTTSLWANL
jgi:hypothetical protein